MFKLIINFSKNFILLRLTAQYPKCELHCIFRNDLMFISLVFFFYLFPRHQKPNIEYLSYFLYLLMKPVGKTIWFILLTNKSYYVKTTCLTFWQPLKNILRYLVVLVLLQISSVYVNSTSRKFSLSNRTVQKELKLSTAAAAVAVV